jgi:hypothetical protein
MSKACTSNFVYLSQIDFANVFRNFLAVRELIFIQHELQIKSRDELFLYSPLPVFRLLTVHAKCLSKIVPLAIAFPILC